MSTWAARVVCLADVATQPWRNGGGVTRELLVGRSAGCASTATACETRAVAAGGAAAAPSADLKTYDWQWRISVADIHADGPFSAFPGVQRWFAVLEGAGVELDLNGRTHRLRAGGPPLAFEGALAPACRLVDGATRDLNLMLRGVAGGMQRVQHQQAWSSQAPCIGLFSLAAGEVLGQRQSWPVPAGALLWLTHEAPAPTPATARATPAANTPVAEPAPPGVTVPLAPTAWRFQAAAEGQAWWIWVGGSTRHGSLATA